MAVKTKDDETVEERRARAANDPVLRAEIAKEAHDTHEETSLDGLSKHVTYVDKDGVGLADETVTTTMAEAVELFKNEILAAVVGVTPAAQSGEVEVKQTGKKEDDEATITIKLSRSAPSWRLPSKKQGTQDK